MDCEKCLEQIDDMTERSEQEEITPEYQAFNRHIASCGACRAEFEAALAIQSAASGLMAEPPETLMASVMYHAGRGKNSSRRLILGRTASLAATVVILLAATWYGGLWRFGSFDGIRTEPESPAFGTADMDAAAGITNESSKNNALREPGTPETGGGSAAFAAGNPDVGIPGGGVPGGDNAANAPASTPAPAGDAPYGESAGGMGGSVSGAAPPASEAAPPAPAPGTLADDAEDDAIDMGAEPNGGDSIRGGNSYGIGGEIWPSSEPDLSGMTLAWQLDCPGFDGARDAVLSLYAAAEYSEEYGLMFDDGQDWALILESGGDFYELFPRRFVQIGMVSCAAYYDWDGANGGFHVLVTVTGTANYMMYDCAYRQDGAFVATRVFDSGVINYFGQSRLP